METTIESNYFASFTWCQQRGQRADEGLGTEGAGGRGRLGAEGGRGTEEAEGPEGAEGSEVSEGVGGVGVVGGGGGAEVKCHQSKSVGAILTIFESSPFIIWMFGWCHHFWQNDIWSNDLLLNDC